MESTPLPLKRDPLEAIRAAFGTANLRRLQFGWAASSVGSSAFMVVLAVYAYGVGGASAVGVAALVRMLPAAFAAPITSLLADRSSRRDVMVRATLVRAASLALVAAAVTAGAPFGAGSTTRASWSAPCWAARWSPRRAPSWHSRPPPPTSCSPPC